MLVNLNCNFSWSCLEIVKKHYFAKSILCTNVEKYKRTKLEMDEKIGLVIPLMKKNST